MYISFLKPRKEFDIIYHCRSVAPEQLFEYPLSILRVRDRVSNGPLVSEYLVVITTLHSDK